MTLNGNKEARLEGYQTWTAFCVTWAKLHPDLVRPDGSPAGPCWRIEFELLKEVPSGKQD